MCWWKVNFLSKIKPRYFYEFLGVRVGPPKGDRLRERGLKGPCDLEK